VHAVSTCIQRMQKVLTQMHIQLAYVISDLSGWTGQRIVRAMLAASAIRTDSRFSAIPAFTQPETDRADGTIAEDACHSEHGGVGTCRIERRG
jgi:hypothetical protein